MPRIRSRRRKPPPEPIKRRADCAAYLACLDVYARQEDPPPNYCRNCRAYMPASLPVTEAEVQGAWRLALATWRPPRLPEELSRQADQGDTYPLVEA